MHHRLKSLSIRSCADELSKPRFSCLPLQRSRAWTQKKELVDMNSIISQHTNPGRSHRRMQQDRGWLAKLSRSTTLLPRLKSGILGLGAPDRLGCCLAKPDSFSVRFHGLCRICRILLRNAVPTNNGSFSGT